MIRKVALACLELTQHFDGDDGVVISLKSRTFLGTRIVVGSFTIRAKDLLKQSQATTEGTLICSVPPGGGECQ